MSKFSFKKLLSVLLTVCLLATLFVNIPLTVSAAATDATSFKNAINSAGSSSVTEINVTGSFTVSDGVVGTQLNNKKIKFIGSGTVTLEKQLYFGSGCEIEFAGPNFKVKSGLDMRLFVGWHNQSGTSTVTFSAGDFDGNIQIQTGYSAYFTGGTFTNNTSGSSNNNTVVIDARSGSISISGGTFDKGAKSTTIRKYDGTFTVTGGSFDQNPGNYVPTSGYMVVRDASTGIYSISTDIPSGAQYINSADDFTSKTSGTLIINKDLTDVSGVEISSGTVTYMGAGSVKFKSSATKALTVTGGANVTIDGPTFNQGTSSRVLCVWEATVKINSGEIIGDIEQQGGTNSTGTLIINGGTFTQTDGNNLIDNRSSTKGGTTTINGGTFTKVGSTAPFTTTSNITFEIKGGTYNFDPSAYVATGYVARSDGNGNYIVGEKSYEAQIGNTKYETLSAAITDASSGATIEILDEVSTGDSLSITKNLTFTGNHTVTFTGGTGLTVATAGITVTINGPTFKQGGATRALCVWKATVIVDAGGFVGLIDQQGGDSTNKGILTINNGTFKQDSSCTNFASGKQAWLVNSSSNAYAETTINNGTFIGEGTQAFINATMGKVTITSGNFTKATGQTGIETNVNCTLSVTGGTFNFNPAGVASGYKATEEPAGTWTVAIDDSKQAKIGSNEYKTLAEAVTAARDGDTIEILDNISGASQIDTKDITAKELTFTGNYTVTFASGSGLTANTGSHITINGPTFVQGGAYRALCVYEATVTVENGGFIGLIDVQGDGSGNSGKAATLIINGGTFTQDSTCQNFATMKAAYLINVCDDNAVVIINNGTFTGDGTEHMINASEGILSINGGTFTKASDQTGIEDTANCGTGIAGGTFNFDPTKFVVEAGKQITESNSSYSVTTKSGIFGTNQQFVMAIAGRNAEISQSLTVVHNTVYNITFKVKIENIANLSVKLNKDVLENKSSDAYTFSGSFTAIGNSALLEIADTSFASVLYVYDVKVTAAGSAENIVTNGSFTNGSASWNASGKLANSTAIDYVYYNARLFSEDIGSIEKVRACLVGKAQPIVAVSGRVINEAYTDRSLNVLDLFILKLNSKGYYGSDIAAQFKKDEILAAKETDVSGVNSSKILYVDSISGSDSNIGTKDKPYKTLSAAISKVGTTSGYYILLKNGGEYRIPKADNESTYTYGFKLPSGTTLGSYGTDSDKKPVLIGSSTDYSDSSWTKVSDNIWKTTLNGSDTAHTAVQPGAIYLFKTGNSTNVPDIVGTRIYKDADGNNVWTDMTYTMVDGDATWSTNTSTTTMQNILTSQATEGLFFTYENNPTFGTDSYEVYMYCSNASGPSAAYSRIEIGERRDILNITSNTTVENITVLFGGGHAINVTSGAENVTIRNCEIGYTGGGSNSGHALGNGIQFSNSGTNLKAIGNYVYQCFDSAITPQTFTTGQEGFTNVEISGNLLENNFYGLEIWGTGESKLSNITVSNNIIRNSGYCWSYDKRIYYSNSSDFASHIYLARNYYCKGANPSITISNNIFDRAKGSFVVGAWDKELYNFDKCQYLTVEGNTYYQSKYTNDSRGMMYGGFAYGGNCYDVQQYVYSQSNLETAVEKFESSETAITIWLTIPE